MPENVDICFVESVHDRTVVCWYQCNDYSHVDDIVLMTGARAPKLLSSCNLLPMFIITLMLAHDGAAWYGNWPRLHFVQ